MGLTPKIYYEIRTMGKATSHQAPRDQTSLSFLSLSHSLASRRWTDLFNHLLGLHDPHVDAPA
jgi:hypothetical protein